MVSSSHAAPGNTILSAISSSVPRIKQQLQKAYTEIQNYWIPANPQWFEHVFGIPEPEKANLSQINDWIKTNFEYDYFRNVLTVNTTNPSRSFDVGPFSTPSVSEMLNRLDDLPDKDLNRRLTFQVISDKQLDVIKYITNPNNANAVFQVASQFNCLEMKGPSVLPSNGITIYVSDKTQGPACSIACPAATLFRNYFVNHKVSSVPSRRIYNGQLTSQLNLLTDSLDTLNDGQTAIPSQNDGQTAIPSQRHNDRQQVRYKNGYILNFEPINKYLTDNTSDTYKNFVNNLRVGVQWDTPVWNVPDQKVCQVFCSALPVGYENYNPDDVKNVCTAVLLGAYENTLLIAEKKRRYLVDNGKLNNTDRIKVYLTLVGCGAFGNKIEWVKDVLQTLFKKYKDLLLDIYMLDRDGNFTDTYSVSKLSHLSVDDDEFDEEKQEVLDPPLELNQDPITLPVQHPLFTKSQETDVIAIMTGSYNPVHPSHFAMAEHTYNSLTADSSGFTVENGGNTKYHLKCIVMSASHNRWAHDISKKHLTYVKLDQSDRNTLIEIGCWSLPGVFNTRVEEYQDFNHAIDWPVAVTLYYKKLRTKGFKGKIAYLFGQDHAQHVDCNSFENEQHLNPMYHPHLNDDDKKDIKTNFMYFVIPRKDSIVDIQTRFSSCKYKIIPDDQKKSVGNTSSTAIRQIIEDIITNGKDIAEINKIYSGYSNVLASLYQMIIVNNKGLSKQMIKVFNQSGMVVLNSQPSGSSNLLRTQVHRTMAPNADVRHSSAAHAASSRDSPQNYLFMSHKDMLRAEQNTNHWYSSQRLTEELKKPNKKVLFWSSTFFDEQVIKSMLHMLNDYINSHHSSNVIVFCSPSTYVPGKQNNQETDDHIKKTKKERIEKLINVMTGMQFDMKNFFFLNDYVEFKTSEYSIDFTNTIDCYGKDTNLIDFDRSYLIFRTDIIKLQKFKNNQVKKEHIKLLSFRMNQNKDEIYKNMSLLQDYDKSTVIIEDQSKVLDNLPNYQCFAEIYKVSSSLR